MINMNNNILSLEESAVYDRQIRTWGLDTQVKIQQSKVAIIGLNGLGAEIAKNLVLAGVGELALIDDEKVKETDLASQFFLTSEDIGDNRANASEKRIQELNQRAKVYTTEWENDDKFINQFDIICITHYNPVVMHSYMVYLECIFLDLHKDFEFSKKVSDGTFEKDKISYISWSELQQIPWKTIPPMFGRRRKQLVSDVYFCISTFNKLSDELQRAPTMNDWDALLKLKAKILKEQEIDAKWLPDHMLEGILAAQNLQISPVCSIFGGSLAQQIITIISKKECPYRNIVIYDAGNSRSGVANIGCPVNTKGTVKTAKVTEIHIDQPAKKKQKISVVLD